jgi:hypothetical protein
MPILTSSTTISLPFLLTTTVPLTQHLQPI